MGKIESAISWMEALANDDSHGYSQYWRWGPDYDCSSAVCTAWEQAGVPVVTNGAVNTWTINSVFPAMGFNDVTSKVNMATGAGLVRGDVLLSVDHHVAMYCGNGVEVEASSDENGSIEGYNTGDQDGHEIQIRSYRNYPWDKVFRYYEEVTPEPEPTDWKAKGTAICSENDVNLRAVPAGSIVGKINCGQRFEIDGQTDRGWTHAYVAGVGVCWIFTQYVVKDETWKAKGTATCTDDDVNVRATASEANDDNIMGKLGKGNRFEVDGKTSGDWIHVKVEGIGIGWVHKNWVKNDTVKKSK